MVETDGQDLNVYVQILYFNFEKLVPKHRLLSPKAIADLSEQWYTITSIIVADVHPELFANDFPVGQNRFSKYIQGYNCAYTSEFKMKFHHDTSTSDVLVGV